MRQLLADKNIEVVYENNLTKVEDGVATFSKTGEINYNMLHVVPPMGPYNVHKNLGNEAGWVDVNQYTLQHNKFKNIWSLGDCSSCPTSKTAAAIAGQNKVLFDNLMTCLNNPNSPLTAKYDGYTACPLVTSYNDGLFAEFDYELKRRETTFFDQRKVHGPLYFIKKEILPFIYWQLHVTGKWQGPELYRKIMAPLKRN